MLAPRKKLWSTPPSAVDHLVEHIPLGPRDVVLDIGCGDGRILLQWAERVSLQQKQDDDKNPSTTQPQLTFLGIDIDASRIQECQQAAQQAQADGRIHPNVRLEFTCANALESVDHFQKATVIFMYLIPRGLQLIYPLLKEHVERLHQQQPATVVRVATYMSKLPKEAGPPKFRATCQVPHQPDAAWPLYFYEFKKKS